METLIPPEVVWPFIISAVAGFGLIVLVFLIRLHYQLQADVKRHTYELFFSSGMTKLDELEFIRSVSTVPKPGFLRPLYPVVFERYADHLGSRYFLSTPGGAEESVDKLFLEHVRGQMELVEVDPVAETVWDAAREYNTSAGALTNTFRITSMEGAAATIGTAFKDLQAGEVKVMQWTVLPDRPRRATPENKDKVSQHTFHVLLRIAAKGERPKNMLDGIISPFYSVASSDAKLTQRPMPGVVDRLRKRTSALAHMGYLNATELATVLGWPLDGSGPRMARRLAPTAAHDEPSGGTITLGTSNAPKMKHRKVAMPIYGEQNRSILLLGESGSGKSVLLANLAVQLISKPDIAFLGMEPAGDLMELILKCAPGERAKDVIYFDPLDSEYPIGLNPLKGTDPEHVASHIVSMFKTLYKDTWSASMQRVMTTAVTTAALLDGTLYDAMLLLTSEDYRTAELKKLRRHQYPDLFESWDSIIRRGDIATDSTVNRFHALMGFRTVRNILSQREGLDFDWILREHKVLLMPLPGARMGGTNAAVIGSLAREMMQSALMRQPPPASSRHKATIMLDEAQNYLSESLSETDAFAEIRKYGGQFIIANQFTDQLGKLQQTVGQNVPTKGVFRSSPEEAKKLQGYFDPLSADDLSNLGRFDIALRINGSAGMAPTVTLHTPPPPAMTPHWSSIINNTRKNYARPRAEVEAEIAARHKKPEGRKKPTIGVFEDEL